MQRNGPNETPYNSMILALLFNSSEAYDAYPYLLLSFPLELGVAVWVALASNIWLHGTSVYKQLAVGENALLSFPALVIWKFVIGWACQLESLSYNAGHISFS